MLFQGQTGPQVNNDGANPAARIDKTGCLVVSECHGRFFEQAYRGNMYSNGATTTALSANTITLTATTTPILGVWNPPNSLTNLVILQASLSIAVNAASAVANGGFVWATSIGNNVISTGTSPLNRKTLQLMGSQAKGMAFVALTGLTNNLVIQFGSALGGLIAAQGATVTPIVAPTGVENFDGSLIIPPGGVLALLNTVSTTTVSVAGALLWEEVAL